jgi:tRNA 2-(methylsulfanyl)-N6-isopentenyladenosine37 hydroxylase
MLQIATPRAWIDHAAQHWQQLLLDHANCEKKAASTALAFMFAYPEDRALCQALARLAREELRHFEQVQKLLLQLGVPSQRLAPSRYAAGLRAALATHEPQRKLDLLLAGALIEARSCERFEAVAPQLQDPLRGFYTDLAVSERRHARLYLDLARERIGGDLDADWLERRLLQLAQVEASLIQAPDPEFRFHSGVPEVRVACDA